MALAIALAAAALDAQSALKPLSLDAIYDPQTRANFSGSVPQASWLDDNTYLLRRPGAAWQKVNAALRRQPRRSTTPPRWRTRWRRCPACRATDAAAAARGAARVQRHATPRVVVTLGGDLYFYDFASRPRRAAHGAGGRRRGSCRSVPTARRSPSCATHNLYAVDVASARERALTADGGAADLQRQARLAVSGRDLRPRQLQGLLVEPGLVAARVPAARRAAGARVHRHRPSFPTGPALEVTDYPKAGDPNPLVRSASCAAAGGPSCGPTRAPTPGRRR